MFVPIRFPCPFSPHPKRSFRLVWCDLVKCRVKTAPAFFAFAVTALLARFAQSCCHLLDDFGPGNGMKDAPFFQSFLANRQRCCSTCSVWSLQFERRVRRHHSRCPFFSAIRARVMFSCFRFLPCLGFEELHLLCMFHLGIAEYFLPRCVFPFLP